MPDLILPADISVAEGVKPDDVVLCFKVPRDNRVVALKPNIPASVARMAKTFSVAYDVEGPDMVRTAKMCVVNMLVAKSKATEVIGLINGKPNSEVELVTTEKENSTKQKFGEFEERKKAAEDSRTYTLGGS